MHVVAVCELAATLDDEVDAVAGALGMAPYDVRLRLAGTLPRVLATSTDASAARAACDLLCRRGHGALTFDADDAPSVDRMPVLKSFSLANGELHADHAGPSQPVERITAVVRFVLSGDVDHVVREKRLVYSGRSLAPATREEEQIRTRRNRTERALLIFREGEPWVLDPARAKYAALGPLRPTQHENFARLIAWLTSLSPGVTVDDRFVEHPLAVQKRAEVRAPLPATAAPVRADRPVDWTLHALAQWLMMRRGGPYRGVRPG